jgi:hypothetical protein
MALAKEHAMQVILRGFADTGDRAICLNCIIDTGLRAETSHYLTEPQCTFCQAKNDNGEPIAADFESFMNLVMTGVRFLYNGANDEGVPRDEGDWVGATIYTTADVIETVCFDAVTEDVLPVITDLAHVDDWTQRDFALLRPDRALRRGWDEFGRKVKHESRFVFLSRPEQSSMLPDDFTTAEFLRKLEHIIIWTDNLLQSVPAGRVFWRGRLVDSPGTTGYTAATLGTPPAHLASSSRMSPAGIPMFYASDDIDTVVAEIAAHSARRYAVVGAFQTVRDLTLLNLAELPPIPSVFTAEGRERHFDVRFLHDFAADLGKPIVLDGREHIDYVPTQVVTEYLRWIPDFALDGILYRSAQNGGVCCVLFCDATGCADPGALTGESRLQLQPGSVRSVRVVAKPEQL